jgi:hypothetical protein
MTRRLVLVILAGAAAAEARQWSAEQTRPLVVQFDVQGGRLVAMEGKLLEALEMKTTTGAPYSADATTEFVQVLADGNRIVRRTVTRIFRDSEGRVRRESIGADGSIDSISIVDPVSGVSATLDPDTKTFESGQGKFTAVARGGKAFAVKTHDDPDLDKHLAERKKQIEILANKVRVAEKPASNGQTARHEDLGQRTIDGVAARGTRTTTTIPAGSIGNEQPIHVVSEEWFSPDLQVVVLTKHSDPRSGETVYSLTGINRAEPGRALFEVPADYARRGRF